MEPDTLPSTPDWMAPLSRELKEVIEERNLLTCRTRRRVLDDMEAAASQQEDDEMERLRKKAVEEVISSEKSYLKHLEIVQEYFMRPLEDSDLIPRSEFVKIFGDLPSILQVNRELLKCLEESNDRIGKVFNQLAPYLKFYSTYANEFKNAVKTVDKRMCKSREFRVLVQNQETRPEVQLKLNSLLITPVQRIPRYKLLLDDVIKKTPDNHPDKASLISALEQIDGVAWHINEQLGEHENSIQLLDIQRSLVGGQPKIIAPGRRLLKQGLLMKVPRTGASGGGQPRYFVLFSDMIMYCKIRGSGALSLPKHNALDCGCALPLKLTSVESVVGRGVFKLMCQKEELLLYSKDGASASQEWVEAIQQATATHKINAATLRKESSRRTPLKRPDLLKLRRESLSQIMMIRLTKEKAKKLLLTPRSSSAKKARREANSCDASPKLRKRKASASAESPMETTPKCAKRIRPVGTPTTSTPPIRTPQSEAQIKAKNRQTLRWQTLVRNRKNVLKAEHNRGKVALFRSPSIFDKQDDQDDDVMSNYLSGKIVPLTPSQAPTNVSHLAKHSDGSTLSEGFSLSTPSANPSGAEKSLKADADTISTNQQTQESQSYCVVM